jgi:hypothetical protein
MADQDDDLHDSVTAMADRLGLKGNDRRRYVHEHMTRSGYRMEPTYVPDTDTDDDDDDDGSPFFGKSRSRSSSRSRGRDDDDDRGHRSPRRGRNRSDDNWYS